MYRCAAAYLALGRLRLVRVRPLPEVVLGEAVEEHDVAKVEVLLRERDDLGDVQHPGAGERVLCVRKVRSKSTSM